MRFSPQRDAMDSEDVHQLVAVASAGRSDARIAARDATSGGAPTRRGGIKRRKRGHRSALAHALLASAARSATLNKPLRHAIPGEEGDARIPPDEIQNLAGDEHLPARTSRNFGDDAEGLKFAEIDDAAAGVTPSSSSPPDRDRGQSERSSISVPRRPTISRSVRQHGSVPEGPQVVVQLLPLLCALGHAAQKKRNPLPPGAARAHVQQEIDIFVPVPFK